MYCHYTVTELLVVVWIVDICLTLESAKYIKIVAGKFFIIGEYTSKIGYHGLPVISNDVDEAPHCPTY